MPTLADLRELLAPHRPPCVSLYQPTHRSYPASTQEDPIRFRNLLRRAETALRETYPVRELQPVVDALARYADDADFWIEAAEGLAVFGSADATRVFRLHQRVPELVAVADHFQVKPLIRSIQRDGRFQVLALTLSEAKLYEGTRETLEEVVLEGAALTLTAALGTEVTEPYMKVTRGYGSGAQGPAMHHGHGSRKDERPLDRERFFRAVDRQILERASSVSRLPLVLVALPENQAHFRVSSHNPFLVATGVALDPGALDLGQLRRAAWEALQPYFEERLRGLIDAYGEALGHGRGSERLEDIAQALTQGRVHTLLLEQDRRIPGAFDAGRGALARAEPSAAPDTAPSRAAMPDVLDDLAEAALRSGGEVVILPAERMPSQTGAAAVYRY